MTLGTVSIQAANLTKMEEATLYVEKELKTNFYPQKVSHGNIVGLRAFESYWSKEVFIITKYEIDLDLVKGSNSLLTKEEYRKFHNDFKYEFRKVQIKQVCSNDQLRKLLSKGIVARNTFLWTNIKDNVTTSPVIRTNVGNATCIENGF